MDTDLRQAVRDGNLDQSVIDQWKLRKPMNILNLIRNRSIVDFDPTLEITENNSTELPFYWG